MCQPKSGVKVKGSRMEVQRRAAFFQVPGEVGGVAGVEGDQVRPAGAPGVTCGEGDADEDDFLERAVVQGAQEFALLVARDAAFDLQLLDPPHVWGELCDEPPPAYALLSSFNRRTVVGFWLAAAYVVCVETQVGQDPSHMCDEDSAPGLELH